ncbi:unnamed protein product [Didymodactylos carnosus]|uniref:SLC12A transporter C-terminal domain-containing protein n=1 Tax=Didymodactylos carnosus TaxID=1234261 RepID=A0A813YY85_9BILA|nr:unnamed protein product [Didymodactylos carnosus]CAF3675081.1 unnamed protein product [Didymodactylos carnosus]
MYGLRSRSLKSYEKFEEQKTSSWKISASELEGNEIKRGLRLHEMLLEYSSTSTLIIVILAIPRKNSISCGLYMSCLKSIRHDLPPLVFLRGNQRLWNLIRRSLISNLFQAGQTMKLGTLLRLPFDSPTHEQQLGRHLPNVFMAEFRIHCCSYSYIYIHTPLRCGEIRKCHNVTIVFGSIEVRLKQH